MHQVVLKLIALADQGKLESYEAETCLGKLKIFLKPEKFEEVRSAFNAGPKNLQTVLRQLSE